MVAYNLRENAQKIDMVKLVLISILLKFNLQPSFIKA